MASLSLRTTISLALLAAAACTRTSPHESSPLPAPDATAPAVVIDARFDDWRSPASSVSRPVDASHASDALGSQASLADVTSLAQQSDGRFVYLSLSLARAASLYGLASTLSIAFDADDDARTGATVDGLAGTDVTLDFSPRAPNGRVGEGAALRVFARDGAERAGDTYPLEFVMQPTVASDRFEMRIARGRALRDSAAPERVTTPLFSASRFRAQLVGRDSAGAIRYRLPILTGSLVPLDTAARPPAAVDPIARARGTEFRTLVWNVANEGIQARPDRFRRIISALDPDLLVLNEVGGVIGTEGVRAFLATVGDPTRGAWHFTYGAAGGYQRTVIASRSAVDELPELRLITFPDTMTERLLAAVPQSTRERQRSSLRDGVPTGGAIVTLGGRRAMVVGVDLQSAGNAPGSWQEMRRVAEARLIRDHTGAALRTRGPVDGVIIAGDHNLVGTYEPLRTLREAGVAFNRRALTSADPLLQLDGATAATWDGRGGPFPPGRLDWFSYSDRTLEVLRGFVFDASDLGPRWREAHGIDVSDSERSSDHRPLVIDLRWRR